MDFSNVSQNFAKSSPPSVVADDELHHHQHHHLAGLPTTPPLSRFNADASLNLNSNSGYATPTYEGSAHAGGGGSGGAGGGPGGGGGGGAGCKSLKHFKKSMIVEYESSHVGEDSQSSSSSTSSSSSSTVASHLSFKSASSSNHPPAPGSQTATPRSSDLSHTPGKTDSASSRPAGGSKSSSSNSKSTDPAKKPAGDSSKSKKAKRPESKKPSSGHSSSSKSKSSGKSSSSSKDKSKKQQHSKQLYCICKSADTSRFMIACDKCDEWYHGDCVGVTQNLSKKIKTFFCHICRHKNSELKIRYKRKFHKFLKALHKNPNRKEALLAKGEIYSRFYKETRLREKKEAQLLSLNKDKDKSKKAKKQHTDSGGDSLEPGSPSVKAVKREPGSQASAPLESATNRNTSFDALLSTTESLLNMENTSSSSSKPSELSASGAAAIKQQHFGKSNVSGEDIENFFSALTRLGNDVIPINSGASLPAYPGGDAAESTKPGSLESVARPPADAVKQETKGADHSKKRPTASSDSKSKSSNKRAKRQSQDSAETDDVGKPGDNKKRPRRSSSSGSSSSVSSSASTFSSSSSDKSSESSDAASDVDSSGSDESDGRDEYETDSYDRTKHNDHSSDSDSSSGEAGSSDEDSDDSATRRKSHKKEDASSKKKPGDKKTSSSKSQSSKSSKLNKKSSGSSSKPSSKNKSKGDEESQAAKQQKRRYTMVNRRPGAGQGAEPSKSKSADAARSALNGHQTRQPTQCLGPGCVNAAVGESKYCSDKCGLALAKERLLVFLEPHLAEYQKMPCYSDVYNRNQLNKINSEIGSMRQKLAELEARHVELDKLIEKAKSARIDPSVEKEQEKLFENNEIEVCCVSCGHPFSERHAYKHMEKCFNKIESQASFGSFYKTHIDGQSMFCDYYNPQTKMYCKRLKVMCPEHEKEKKIGENEVCGCPLPKDDSIAADESPSRAEAICLAAKRTCPLHVKWEKVKRAQIDLEKLRTWLKLEELLEKKRFNEISLNQRGSLMSVLLHQTVAHEGAPHLNGTEQPTIANQA